MNEGGWQEKHVLSLVIHDSSQSLEGAGASGEQLGADISLLILKRPESV